MGVELFAFTFQQTLDALLVCGCVFFYFLFGCRWCCWWCCFYNTKTVGAAVFVLYLPWVCWLYGIHTWDQIKARRISMGWFKPLHSPSFYIPMHLQRIFPHIIAHILYMPQMCLIKVIKIPAIRKCKNLREKDRHY